MKTATILATIEYDEKDSAELFGAAGGIGDEMIAMFAALAKRADISFRVDSIRAIDGKPMEQNYAAN